jgi:nucleotide-binding universal stress UspA family protein
MKLDRILVAVDGSQNSVAAVAWAADLAAATGAEVVAVHALGLLDRLEGGVLAPSGTHRDKIRALLETTWTEPLHREDVRSRCLLRDGDAVSVVLSAAEDEAADLVVVGSRGLGGYPQLLLGSTSTQVAQRSHRPVTIVPLSDGGDL